MITGSPTNLVDLELVMRDQRLLGLGVVVVFVQA